MIARVHGDPFFAIILALLAIIVGSGLASILVSLWWWLVMWPSLYLLLGLIERDLDG